MKQFFTIILLFIFILTGYLHNSVSLFAAQNSDIYLDEFCEETTEKSKCFNPYCIEDGGIISGFKIKISLINYDIDIKKHTNFSEIFLTEKFKCVKNNTNFVNNRYIFYNIYNKGYHKLIKIMKSNI